MTLRVFHHLSPLKKQKTKLPLLVHADVLKIAIDTGSTGKQSGTDIWLAGSVLSAVIE